MAADLVRSAAFQFKEYSGYGHKIDNPSVINTAIRTTNFHIRLL